MFIMILFSVQFAFSENCHDLCISASKKMQMKTRKPEGKERSELIPKSYEAINIVSLYKISIDCLSSLV